MSTLTRISESTYTGTASEVIAKLNTTISEAETAINALESTVNGKDINRNALIQYNMPIASGVIAGDLVYYNASSSLFDKALACTRDVPLSNGAPVAGDRAIVVGLVISAFTTGSASITSAGHILCGGYYKGAAVNTCLNIDGNSVASCGLYYLSPVSEGGVTLDPGISFRQPVFTYLGDSAITMHTTYLAHDNHYHASYAINGNDWTAAGTGIYKVDSAVFASANIPNIAKDTTAVFSGGHLIAATDNLTSLAAGGVCISGGTLYTSATAAPTASAFVVFNNYPFNYGGPIVRNATGSGTVEVVNNNGTLTITNKPYSYGSSSLAGRAVVDISEDNILTYTPVVTDILPGADVDVTASDNGIYTIALRTKANTLIEATNVAHNGTTVTNGGSGDPLQYITYPISRTSCSISIQAPLTGIASLDTSVSHNVNVWVMASGKDAPTDGSTAAKVLSVSDIKFIPDNTTGSSFVGSAGTSTTINIPAITSGNFAYATTNAAVLSSITSNGTIAATIGVSGNAALTENINILKAGFIIVPNVTSVTTRSTETETITYANAVSATGIAGEAIAKNSPVYATGGYLYKCTNTNSATANKCVGITLSSYTAGNTVTYVNTGIIKEMSTTGLAAGVGVYIGTNGALTTTIPATGYIQKVGIGLATASMVVCIEPAIIND